MAIKLPKVHVPITVDTRGVDTGLAKAEAKLKASTTRMAKTSAAGPSGGGLSLARAGFAGLGSAGGLGPLSGVLGAGMAGAGPLGAVAAGAVIPVAISNAVNRMIDTASKGAMEALKDFRETGKQTFAANQIVLERLAAVDLQRQMTAMPSPGQAFVGAMAGEGGQMGPLASWASSMKEGMTILAGYLGAQAGGKSVEVSALEASLAATTNESMARRLQETIDRFEASQQGKNQLELIYDRISSFFNYVTSRGSQL